MKRICSSILAIQLLAVAGLSAQGESPEPTNTGDPSTSSESSVKVVGTIPDGTEQAPTEPKPRVIFQPDDVKICRVESLGDRAVSFEKVTPMILPAPVEEVSTSSTIDPQMQQRLRPKKARKNIFLSASVYQPADESGSVVTLVKYWPRKDGSAVTLWVNANFLWLTGFGEYETPETHYSLMMAVSKLNLATQAQLAERAGRTFEPPAFPEFPDHGQATIIVQDGNPTDEELAPIKALIQLYNTDKEKLKQASEQRVAASEERARIARENPPEKKNIVLKYWRVDEAGQAGETTKPADIR
jgi:hypothetical protein